jgi:hypothetical protein
MQPIVVGTPDAAPPKAAKTPPAKTGDKSASPAKPSGPAADIRTDAKSHTVRFSAAFGRPGVVEWLLTAGLKHAGLAVLSTPHSAQDLARAFATAGFPAGRPPVLAGDDVARPPAGAPVEISVILKGKDGQEVRCPAARLLSEKPRGEPLCEGQWIYVGPQPIREGDAEILVTELSGSVATTNLRDTSAFIYWVPKRTGAEPSVPTYHTSGAVPIEKDSPGEVEVRLVAPKASGEPPAMPKVKGEK